MYDLDELKGKVRTPSSRRYIDEAISCYGAAAYRSAIIATWIAVAADIIDKIRILADSGEGGAVSLRTTLDNAIKSKRVPDLSRFESDILRAAKDDLHLLGDREYVELLRLYQDRHLCAHPAYIEGGDQLFQPTPELVRMHIRAAIDGLLSQHAVIGRKAIERFEHEINEDSFPSSDIKLSEYLKAGYLDRATPAARSNLISTICYRTLDPDLEAQQRWKYTRTARAFQQLDPMTYAEQATRVLDKVQRNLSQDGLWMLINGLCYIPGTWATLNADVQVRIEQLIHSAPVAEMVMQHQLYEPLPPAPLDQFLVDRLDEALSLRSPFISAYIYGTPNPILLKSLIDRLTGVKNYRRGAEILAWINALAPSFSQNDLAEVIEAACANDQVFGSVLAARQMRELRMATTHLDPTETLWAAWDQAILTE